MRRPLGGWYVFVGDFTGHGLPASVGAFPASKVFFSMTAKQFPAGDIAREMNRALVGALPEFMFCAAAILEMQEDGTTLRIWHGGLPDILIRRHNGDVEVRQSRHMPLGVLAGPQFDAETDELTLSVGEQILVITDGLIESQHPQKGMYGETRLYEQVARGGPVTLDTVLGDWRDFVGDERAQDDVSLALLTVTEPEPVQPLELPEQIWIPWEMRYGWTAEALRTRPDPVSDMVDQLPLPWAYSVHKGNIKVILNELFSNALEHGLLDLDSKMRLTESGMVDYYTEREARLASLETGKVSVRLALTLEGDKPVIQIQVTDTGRGFDTTAFQARLSAPEQDSELSFGRGLRLVVSLCAHIRFADQGRTVRAVYPLIPED